MNNLVKISKDRPSRRYAIHSAQAGKPACGHGSENLAWQETTEPVTCHSCRKLSAKPKD